MPSRIQPAASLIRDRRSAPRITCRLDAVLRDAAYAWKANVQNFSSTGCLLALANKLPAGKELELELRPEGRAALKLRGRIVHVSVGQAGFELDLSRADDYERTVDLFEWMLAQQPALAVEVQKRPLELPKSAVLFTLPDTDVEPRPEERRMMTVFVGGRSLADAEKVLGPQFEALQYLVFAMLDRKLLTRVQPGMYSRRD